MDCSTPGFPVLHYLLEFAQIHVHWVGDAIQPSHPLTSSSCPSSCPISGSVPVSHLFTSGDQSIGTSASVLSMNIQGWFFFRIDWFGLLAVQGTLKSIFQHHSSEAWVVRHSFFFMVQLSHLYMTTGKIIVLTIWNFVGNKVICWHVTRSRTMQLEPDIHDIFRMVVLFLWDAPLVCLKQSR